MGEGNANIIVTEAFTEQFNLLLRLYFSSIFCLKEITIYHLNNKKIPNYQNLEQYTEEHWATGDNRRCIREAGTKKLKHRVEGIKLMASETR